MFAKFSLVALVAAVLSGTVMAQRPDTPGSTCTPGQFYCGAYLESGQFRELWESRIDDALARVGQPIDATHRYNSLYQCLTPTTVGFDNFCPEFKTPSGQAWLCQQYSSNRCRAPGSTSVNDCCGAP